MMRTNPTFYDWVLLGLILIIVFLFCFCTPAPAQRPLFDCLPSGWLNSEGGDR